jgi:ADP-ribose pyrophosphatase
VILDFPAGYLDSPGEDPLACTQRELLEETGYAAQSWTALGAWSIDSNRMPNLAHLYFARGLRRVADPHLDDTEAIEIVTLPARQLPGLIRAGQMPTLACAAAWGLAAPHVFG